MDVPKRFRDSRIDSTDRRLSAVRSHVVDVTGQVRLNLLKHLNQMGAVGSRFQHSSLSGVTSVVGKQARLNKGTSILSCVARNERMERPKKVVGEDTSYEKHVERLRHLFGRR